MEGTPYSIRVQVGSTPFVLRSEAFTRLHPGITEQLVEGGIRKSPHTVWGLPNTRGRGKVDAQSHRCNTFQKHYCVLKIRGARITSVSEQN